MNIKWTEVQPPTFAKFEKVGDGVAGEVLHYSPLTGAMCFDKETECGYIDLRDLKDGTIHRVALDKPALNDRLSCAYPSTGDLIGIKFTGTKDTGKGQPYKQFSVFTGEKEA